MIIRRPAVVKNQPGLQTSITKSIPAPIFGWNTRDSLANMKEGYAIILENFFPSRSEVKLRSGSLNWVTGITGQVETLASYSSPAAKKLFAANASAIYEVTSTGAVGAAVQSGLSNGRWQKANFSTGSGTSYLYLVNGADKPRLYDGTNWTAIDGASTPAITGVTTTNLIHVNAFKTRLWFIEKNTMKVWYLPTNSIGGAENSLDFGAIFTRGGHLVAMGTWSLDAGYGLDDYAVFITNIGQIAVYKGTDPTSASTWSLIGVYDLGSPIGTRCCQKYSGDLLVISRDGLLPLSKALMSSRVNSQINLTDDIAPTISNSSTAYASNFGWEIILYAPENMLILNVPAGVGNQIQYVMNTITGAWCSFSGWPANTFEVHDDELYYGGNGVVVKAYTGTSDNDTNIVGKALPAFAYFGNSGQLKQWKLVRPIISSNGSPGVLLDINVDLNVAPPTGTPSFTENLQAVWDANKWDVALWGSDYELKRDWQSVFGLGYCASPSMIVSSNSATFSWASTDFVFENGGIL